MSRPEYCYDLDLLEGDEPCPLCGATESGDDPVRGVCQARYTWHKTPPLIRIIVVEKEPRLT